MKEKKTLRTEKWISLVLAAVIIFILLGITVMQVNQTGDEEYRVVCLGDSIIGNVRDESSVTAVMERELDEPVFNGAFGGTCASLSNVQYRPTYYEDSVNLVELADAIAYNDFSVQFYDITSNNFRLDYFEPVLRQMAEVDFEQVELLFIEHGINDYSAGRPIDNPENPLDVYTYAGALRYSIEKIREAYPDIKIVLVTPLYCYFLEDGKRALDSETADFGHGPLQNYVDAELQIAEEYGLDVVDNFHNLGINSDNIDEYVEDGIHLNEKGRKLLANALADYIKRD